MENVINRHRKNTLEDLKQELRKVQDAQVDMVDNYGFVMNCERYRYQELVHLGKALRDSIDWLESQ